MATCRPFSKTIILRVLRPLWNAIVFGQQTRRPIQYSSRTLFKRVLIGRALIVITINLCVWGDNSTW